MAKEKQKGARGMTGAGRALSGRPLAWHAEARVP